MLRLSAIPSEMGICKSCTEKEENGKECALTEILPLHRKNVKMYKTFFYKYIDYAAWAEEAIDEPEYDKNQNITWCPLYSKKEK